MVHSSDFYKLYQDTYIHYKSVYGPKVAVFLQKGSFWEFYGQQDPCTLEHLNTVKEFTDILGCQVNYYSGDAPGGLTGLFAGVPEYVLDKWAGKLTALGWTVIVMTQEKNGAGAVIKRSVSRILSPGTHIENAASSTKCIVGCVSTDILIALDVTTGQITYSATVDPHFFHIYPPRELIVYGHGQDIDTIQKKLYLQNTIYYQKHDIPVAYKKPIQQSTYLQDIFQPKTLLPFQTWLDMPTSTYEPLIALLSWIEDHYPSLITCLPKPGKWDSGHQLRIINNALHQLNILGTNGVEKLFANPYSPPGIRALPGILCTPLADSVSILERQSSVAWASTTELKTQIVHHLKQLYDFPRIHRSITRGTLGASGAVQLLQSLKTLDSLHVLLEKSPFIDIDVLHGVRSCIDTLSGLLDNKKALKSMEAPADYGFLHDTIGPESALIEAEIAQIHKSAQDWLDGLCSIGGLDNDSIAFKPTEKNTYSVNGTKANLQILEKAIKKSTTLYSGCNFKILKSGGHVEHNDLDRFQEKLEGKRSQLARTFDREMKKACIHYSGLTHDVWSMIENWTTHVDIIFCFAETNLKNNWNIPCIDVESTMSYVDVSGLRHPLIETQKTNIELVTHDICLSSKKTGLLLYGINASGKSSLMKALGVAVILAQIGCGVPARQMRIAPYKKIASRILNQDNLWAGLSSFAVEMTELGHILKLADEHTLVLGDELCAGTESVSATSIVAGAIHHLLQTRTSFILATHLHDLMKLDTIVNSTSLSIAHLRVHYDMERDILVYDRTLQPGPGSSNYGLTVAKALGLPAAVLEHAYAYRRILRGDTHHETVQTNIYNGELLKHKCGVCDSVITRDLEIHHIQEQKDAKDGVNNDGGALHGLRNLVVVCQTCHDAHHAGRLVIGQVKQTSAGPEREIIHVKEIEPKKNTIVHLSDDVVRLVAETAKTYPHLSSKLLVFQMKELHDIDITTQELGVLKRKKLI